MEKRKVDLVVISDVHLGTIGCHAQELLQYLNSIEPGMLVLNGDIIDIWQFRKSYWPKSHTLVLKKIFELLSAGTPIYYLTGNHDELLRKFSGLKVGNFHLKDKLVMELDGKEAWFFHGDVFDVTMQYSKWLAKLGAVGYDLLILINRMVNWVSFRLGKGRLSLSKRIKDSVKSAIKFINDFEGVAAELAIEKEYAYVVCGHIHQPNMQTYSSAKGEVLYLNSGDWIENLTALEYHQGAWSLYKHDSEAFERIDVKSLSSEVSVLELFASAQSTEEVLLFRQILACTTSNAI
jgi:UDP-2,3-diacylglucosamine pyrophosphatase LpxH